MDRRRPPGTLEGWYVLHDLRRIDWDAWRAAPDRTRERVVEEGLEYLESHAAVADADEGDSAVFSMVGHKADLMIVHLRPTLAQVERAERRLESTALADVTERASSYVSVTEVSGYVHEDVEEGLEAVEDPGARRYMARRLHPEIPDAEHVCFYPMDKRRDPEQNWYDLPFEERAEHISAHGDVGREYAGRVTQIISGSVGLDDHEWGVTLFADDPTDIKDLLYEMRFDPSSSRYAEFGTFYVGRRFPPSDLGAYLAGEAVPTDGTTDTAWAPVAGAASGADDTTSGGPRSAPATGDPPHEQIEGGAFASRAADYGVHVEETDAGYGLLFESDADPDDLEEGLDDLREHFERYDSHVQTSVEVSGATPAVVSLWTTERAADTAAGFLADLPGVDDGVGADLSARTGDGPEQAPDDGPEDGPGDGEAGGDGGGGRPPADPSHEEIDTGEFHRRVRPFGIDLTEHPEAGFALLVRSNADAAALADEVDGLRGNFEHYDTHVLTTVRANAGESAVVSLWATERAADVASGFLADLPGAGPGVGAALPSASTDAPAADSAATDEPADGEPSTGTDGGTAASRPRGTDDASGLRGELADLGVYAGRPHGEDVHAMVLYSEADAARLEDEVATLREDFEADDAHVSTAVYEEALTTDDERADEEGDGGAGEADAGTRAVVSIWETGEAAAAAGERLAGLPGLVGRAGDAADGGGPASAAGGFGTMGMFYTVKPPHREEFLETFAEVGSALAEMEGHRETRLMVNTDDENDMFIASRWREREDALAFFRSEAFRETVEWGREILADRPRHVFLA